MKKSAYHIYIDDTGTSQKTGYDYLDNNKACYVAVCVEECMLSWYKDLLNFLSNKLQTEYGVSEFHWVDIYNGNGVLKNMPPDEKISLIKMFALLFVDEENLPLLPSVFIQSVGGYTNINSSKFRKLKKSDTSSQILYDTDDPAWLAVYSLLKQVNDTYKPFPDISAIKVVIDEGLHKKGKTFNFEKIFGKNIPVEIEFKSSHDEKMLQMADYVAYFFNRHQQLLHKIDISNMESFHGQVYGTIGTVLKTCCPSDSMHFLTPDEVKTKDDLNKKFHELSKANRRTLE